MPNVTATEPLTPYFKHLACELLLAHASDMAYEPAIAFRDDLARMLYRVWAMGRRTQDAAVDG